MFAGEGDPARTNRRFKLLSADGDGDAALDGVRLGHPLRPRPRRAPRHLRQGRHLRRQRRDPRRHEGALRRLRPARPDDVGVDDDQRPGADRAGVLPQHRHRPGPRARHRRRRPRSQRSAAPCRPTSSRRTRARTPACSPPSSRCGCMADIQEWFIEKEVRNFYSVSHLRLPHRRGRGEPDQPARVHPRQRLHLRRGLPRARHGHRRLRAQPVVLLLQRHGPGVLRDRPGRPPDLGGRDEGEVRRQRALAEAEVPRADLRPVPARAGDGLQRHPHHAAGADRDLRQRQLAAHQRLRRGRHHAGRGVRTPRAGDPADHQPRVGPGDEREPAPGLLHHRRAHRPRRGGGARGVRRDQRARRRARRDGDRLPARPDPGRVDALRAPQARRLAADHRRQHLPQARRRRRHPRPRRAGPRHRDGEGVPARPGPRLPGRPRRTRPRTRSPGSRRRRSPATTSSPSSWTPPASARSARSPRRSSRSAASTAATSERRAAVVSLVPSITEALASVRPEAVVGATDWCTHPADLDGRRGCAAPRTPT